MSNKEERMIFDIAYQPQIRIKRGTKDLMRDVLIALIPTAVAAVWQFGLSVLITVLISVAGAVFFEWGYRKLMKKDCRIHDLSAAVTGLILGLSLPPSCPFWVALIGDLFAIVVVKQLYGGIGKNFLNPALAGRAFLLSSYVLILGTFATPAGLKTVVDAESMATPLTYLYGGSALPEYYNYKNLFLGIMPGSMGEVSKLAILIGFAYLLLRKVISWRIPVSFVGTVALLSLVCGKTGYGNADWMLLNVLSGSLLYGAVFMATDYATSPVTARGQLVYGAGCGILTVLIRYFGGYPDGTTYAILIMNLCAWAIDKPFHRSPFGAKKKKYIDYENKAQKYEQLAEKYRGKAGKGDEY